VRKIAVIGLIVLALGALAVIVPASASQNGPSGARWAPRQGHGSNGLTPQAATDVFTTNDNFFTQTYNHFGSASRGSAIAETWMESGFDDTGVATNTQGVARAILLPKALRVSLQVQLRGTNINGDDQLVTTSSTANSSGRLTVQIATPEITLATDTRCFFYTRVTVGIRWSDNRLSTVTFEEPIQFTPGPTACQPPQ
jgi:hypothetical protein